MPFRTASGYPGINIIQQKADYVMDIVLDDEKQKITGSETVTYTNNSPDILHICGGNWSKYACLKILDTRKIQSMSIGDSLSFEPGQIHQSLLMWNFKLEK